MKVTRVIFLIQTPLSKRDYERFGIDIFIKSGFDVIVWDFTRLMYPNQFMKIADVDLIEYENIITFMKANFLIKHNEKTSTKYGKMPQTRTIKELFDKGVINPILFFKSLLS